MSDAPTLSDGFKSVPEHGAVPSIHENNMLQASPDKVLKIVIGTSRMAAEDSALVSRISRFSGKSEGDVRYRLSKGDVGSQAANRVLHIAFLDNIAVGEGQPEGS